MVWEATALPTVPHPMPFDIIWMSNFLVKFSTYEQITVPQKEAIYIC